MVHLRPITEIGLGIYVADEPVMYPCWQRVLLQFTHVGHTTPKDSQMTV